MDTGTQIITFLHQLRLRQSLAPDIEVLNPYTGDEVKRVTSLFYNKYYSDDAERSMILGINPGRFGAGVTGISFTDPVRLEQDCKIPNTLQKRPETSSVFIYKMIRAFGGCTSFYGKFYVSAVCPLGFTAYGRNLNYYDRKDLAAQLHSFIVQNIRKQLAFGLSTEKVFCIGEGKNFRYLNHINQEYHFFKEVIPLPHPRYVMQYKFKEVDRYVENYLMLLT